MKRIISGLITIIIIIGAAAGGIYFWKHYVYTKVTPGTISARLDNASECTTQKLIYHGVVKMEKGIIPLIDKRSFVMTYTATVRAGFDMAEADVDIKDSTINVVIPRTSIQEITIDPDSLEFFDTSFSIINMNKEAVKEALQKAQSDAEEKAASSELLEAADENAETLIKGLLKDSTDNYEITVSHK